MLLSYIERFDFTKSLTKRQVQVVHEQYVLYLISAQSYATSFATIKACLTQDQQMLIPEIREATRNLIEDYKCNALYKLAILRLAQNDTTGFKNLQVNPNPTRAVLRKYRTKVNKRIRQIKFDNIGPTQLKALEVDIIKQLEKHIHWFAMRKAKFLTMAEPGKSILDIMAELQIFAVVALRRFYPFRSNLHLLNSIKSSVTNRGNSLISFNVAGRRRRMFQDDTGATFSVEAGGQLDLESMASSNPTKKIELQTTLNSLKIKHPSMTPLWNYISDENEQDKFVSWYESKNNVKITSPKALFSHIKMRNQDYVKILGRYLQVPSRNVRHALDYLGRNAV